MAICSLWPAPALASTTCGQSGTGAPISDDFTTSPINTSLWTVAAPGGGSVSVSNGHASLTVPGGSNHDPGDGGVNNSVRMTQAVSNADLDVAAKFDSAINLVQYQGTGILVQQDSSTYIRFQLYSDGVTRYLNATSMVNGTGATQLSLTTPNAGQPYWMQVQRTGNTWTLSGSTDGTNYTSAGSFTLPMIVAQIGPFAWNYNSNPASAAAFTASVDYFYNLAAPVPSTCAPISDDFTASPLNTSLWTLTAPAGGSASVSNGHLLFAVPGGSNHDPSIGGVNNSTRVMQAISNTDFSVAAKIDSVVNLIAYQGVGILVQQDSKNYIRFQLYSNGSTRFLNASSMVQGTTGVTQVHVPVPNAGAPYWISVQRAGNTWTLGSSTDGAHYTSAGSFTLPLTVAQIGPFAWNWNSNPASAQAFTASVDYFYNLAAPGSTSSGTPVASLNPTSLSFRSMIVGKSSASAAATLSNTGTAALTIGSISISGTNASDFSETSNCGSSLNPNGTCTINVSFNPTTAGTRSAVLSVATNANGSPSSLSLSGTGTSPGTPSASLTPTSLSFGSVTVGKSSSSATTTLSNTGTAALTISSISLGGTNPGDFSETSNCSSSLSPNNSCTISLSFYPTAAGARSAALSVATNTSGSPLAVSLSGTGTSATSRATATYSTPDYVYPPDAGYYNVKSTPYNCYGDGVHDDTACVQSAITAALNANDPWGYGVHGATVYFPAGTYLVNDTLRWATYGNQNAVITANVDTSRGCITGFNILNAGTGYAPAAYGMHGEPNPGPGLFLSGGGGGGAEFYTTLSGGGVSGFETGLGNYGAGSCAGHGYTSAPTVTVLNWHAYFRFEGQNKAKTVIKLTDNNAKFQNANCNVSPHGDSQARESCRSVVMTANEANPSSTGFGEEGYEDDVWNLTINTGSGNPGAIGLDWSPSNRASIKNLNISSGDGRGRAGLSVARSSSAGTGPGYAKNISINGFDYGIYANAAASEVGNTFEYIDLTKINVAGVLNGVMPNWFRQISANITAPVFINQNGGSLLVVDGTFTGGAANTTAIQFPASSNNGVLFVRNVTTNGYQAALETSSEHTVVPGANISEYAYPGPESLFSSDVLTSLDLPNIPNTPEYIDANLSDWANVSHYGTNCGAWAGDSTSCVQAAMNSGKPVIYFPFGRYNFSSTIHVPSSVRVIVGMNSGIENNGDASRATYPTFSFDGSGPNPVELRNFGFYISDQSNTVVQNGSAPLILADLVNGVNITNTAQGTGDLYLENVAFPQATFNLTSSQRIYARQYDVETSGNNVNVTGGTVWMFGYKSEGSRPGSLWNVSNSTFELLGAFSSTHGGSSPMAAFTFNNSTFSLAGVSAYNGWNSAVSETKNGTTLAAPMNYAWEGGLGYGLFSGHN